MDNQQFQNCTFGLTQQEQERRATQETPEQIRDLIRNTQTCDGATNAAVRNWIREVTFNQVDAPNITEIASKTVAGLLRFELERFIEGVIVTNQVARNATPWAYVRDHLAAQFLNIDESTALRDDLGRLRQSAYETTAQHNRRFRDVADIAYPTGQRTVDQ